MKIILSVAGGGKTFKVAELASKNTHEGKFVQVISTETTKEVFMQFAISSNAQTEFISYNFTNSISDIVSVIMEHPASETVLIDGIFMSFGTLFKKKDQRTEFEAKLKLLKAIEDYTGKEIYATVQANPSTDILNGEKLVIIDYEEYQELNQ